MDLTRALPIFAATTIAAVLGATPASTRADTLNKSVREEAPKVMKYLKDHSLFAFRAGADRPNISSEGGDLATVPTDGAAPRNLAEAQAKIRAATHTSASKGRLLAEHTAHRPAPRRHATHKAGRGLVVEDSQSTTGAGLNRLDTRFDPEPTLSLFIRYYSVPVPL